MASQAHIALRGAKATDRLAKAEQSLAASYGVDIPPPLVGRPSQAPLYQVMTMERLADLLENILSATAVAIGESGGGVDPSMLDGNVTSLKEHIAEMDDLPSLRLLRAAEAGGKTRQSALDAIDKRIADLEATAAEAEEVEEPDAEPGQG